MSDATVSRLETHLGRLLLAGVLSASACLGVGLATWMIAGPSAWATGLMTAGLMILMGTPILRVIVSLVEWIRMRDWFFVVTTVVVLAVLLGTVTIALLKMKGT